MSSEVRFPLRHAQKAFNREGREERLEEWNFLRDSFANFAVKRFSCRFLSNCEPVVEHEVDENTGDRDVEPEREGPAGDGAMAVEALAQGSGQGDDHQGNDDHRKSYMRDQNCEVGGTRPACSLKVYRSD